MATYSTFPQEGVRVNYVFDAFGNVMGLRMPGTKDINGIDQPGTMVGFPQVLSKSAIPFIGVSSGTMGNNGALSAITALPVVYANAYMFFPAGAISAGSVAGWYFTQMSTTQVGIVYNNTYTAGTPTIPAVLVPFVTTGPGGFTGDTGEEFGPTITVPANAMGPNGQLRITPAAQGNATVNAKTFRVRYSGLAGAVYQGVNLSNTQGMTIPVSIVNAGVTNSQKSTFPATVTLGLGSWSGATNVISTVDTTAATTIVQSLQRATATDNLIIESYLIELMYGA